VSARYTVKPKADRDLDDYADYLAREAGVDVALDFLSASHETFALLAGNPNMGWSSRLKSPALKALRVFRVTSDGQTPSRRPSRHEERSMPDDCRDLFQR
jgi:plasmid stabilization system protein ParE